jgi:hypothetical protein
MPEDEWLKLRELEAELASHRRLLALARRLESPGVDTGPRQISGLWIVVGGVLGLALVVAGAVVPNSALVAAGIATLAGTLVVVGAASLVVEAANGRRPGS